MNISLTAAQWRSRIRDTALSDVSAPLPRTRSGGVSVPRLVRQSRGRRGAVSLHTVRQDGRSDAVCVLAGNKGQRQRGIFRLRKDEQRGDDHCLYRFYGRKRRRGHPVGHRRFAVTQIGSNTVAQHGANMVRYSIFGQPDTAKIRSLTIPEGVLVLKENAFRTLKVSEPLQLPSTLERIEAAVLNITGAHIVFSGKRQPYLYRQVSCFTKCALSARSSFRTG